MYATEWLFLKELTTKYAAILSEYKGGICRNNDANNTQAHYTEDTFLTLTVKGVQTDRQSRIHN